MKENNELERSDLHIDPDTQLDCEDSHKIMVYIETWFDVEKKFGSRIPKDSNCWLDMYGNYDPFADTLTLECEICDGETSTFFDYEPTAGEAQLIKDMITEKIQHEYGQTPQEFCDHFGDEEPTMGGMT